MGAELDIRYLASFMLALGAALVMIPLLIRYSARIGLVDDATGDARKIHTGQMPRSGGLGIVVASALAVLLVLPATTGLLSFLAAALVVIAFGLLDDVVAMKPLQKVAGQSLGVLIAMGGGMVISDVPLLGHAPEWFSYPMTFIFVLAVINGVNFSDGMDGLAAGTTLMSLMLLFVLAVEAGHVEVAAVSLSVSAAVLGFLRFNTHPATIFMGDAGSQFLGFVVAWLAIALSQSDVTPMTTFMPLLILGIPVIDILQVVPVRVYKKLPLPGPDKEHFHHQIAKLGLFPYETVSVVYALQAILLAAAYLMRFLDDIHVLVFFVAFTAIVLGGGLVAHVYGWRVRSVAEVTSRRRRNRLFRAISVLHPYTGKFFGVAVHLILTASALFSSSLAATVAIIGFVVGLLSLVVYQMDVDRLRAFVPRITSYLACAILVYGLTSSPVIAGFNFALDLGFLALAFFLAVAIRITRRSYFWITPQDLLVLLFIGMLAPQLPINPGQGVEIGDLVFRTVVLLYASEYLLARGHQAQDYLLYASSSALLVLGVQFL
ncbi:MAG: MraY family glycosyltransferase [Pseudomonadota bacterium]